MEKVSSLLRAADAPEAAVLDPRWWHDLGNAVLGANAALAMAEAELDAGDIGAARAFVRDGLTACGKAITLLRPATALDEQRSDG